MRKFIIGTSLMLLPLLGLGQERYDYHYLRMQSSEEKQILRFIQEKETNNEIAICYDAENKTCTDISQYRGAIKVYPQKYKLDSIMKKSKEMWLIHSHDQKKEIIIQELANTKRKKRRAEQIKEKTLINRIHNEFPNEKDIIAFYFYHDALGVEKQYIEMFGNIYSFVIDTKISLDSTIRARQKVEEIIQQNYCSVFAKPGTCEEPSKKTISQLINKHTPITVLDCNVQMPKAEKLFDEADKTINNFLKKQASEHYIIYDEDHKTLTDLTVESKLDKARINLQKLDSVLQETQNAVLAHNHKFARMPFTKYPSKEDVLQELALKMKYKERNLTFRIYPESTKNISVEYGLPKQFLENLSENKEKNTQYIKRIARRFEQEKLVVQEYLEREKQPRLSYDFQSIPLILREEAKEE